MLSTQPAPAAAARISQVLPTVKCSSCRVDLPLDELGSHVCAPAAAPMPMPTVSIPPRLGIPKPAMSPGAAAALLPTRLQGLVKPQGPNTQPPPPQPNTLPPPRTNTPIQQPPRNNTPVQPPPPRNNAPIQIPRNNTPTQPPRNTTPLQRPTLNTTLPIKAAYPPARPSPLSRDAPRAQSLSRDDTRPPRPDFAAPPRGRAGSASSPLTPVARPVVAVAVDIDERGVDTASGGEAGMAGVGRRGFAAAARAAMFASTIDTGGSKMANTTTPPLSTSTSTSNSPGVAPYPESPSPSPLSPEMFGRGRRSPSPVPTPIALKSQASIASSKASSSSGSSSGNRRRPGGGEASVSASVSQSSESEYGGLAYADSTDYEDGEESAPSVGSGGPAESVAKTSTSGSARSESPARRFRSPSSDSGSDYGDGAPPAVVPAPTPRAGHSRKGSRESAVSMRKVSQEKDVSRGRSPAPARRAAGGKKPKVCLRCEKTIEDGKWVAMDEGGVLCERCWKNLYLPKCRRCNLPIEKQAVSSSDGQLKGKYHRECFNCHVCNKPFPDKTFYVHDHKPMCAYHYHEANDSLCAAGTCGAPIEGPCAVSHAGDRYHPEHMLCEYPGAAGCRERLAEYWEVDGRMLCERHSRVREEEGGGGWKQSARAMKRTTRYIDLARR